MRLKIFCLVFLFSVQCKAQYYFEPIGTGQGITASIGTGVLSLCADTSHHLLYVLGKYQKADGVIYNGSCIWNGNNYDSLLNFVSVPSSAWVNSVMWGDTTVIHWDGNIYLLNGTQILPIPIPSIGILSDIIIYNNELYVAGNSEIADGGKQLARWDGTQWHSVGGSLTGGFTPYTIETIGTYNNDLIVAGHFDSIGGVAAKNIARWDGLQWHDMGGADPTSTSGTYIHAMKQYNGNFYIAGGFGEVGGVSCLGFAKWDGTNWNVPQGAENILFDATDLDIYHNKLFISGLIGMGIDQGVLASYNGDTITTYKGYAWMYTLEVLDSFLYVGGSFDSLGGIYCKRIARFYEDSATGLYEVPIKNGAINIYPNPVTESVTVTWDVEAKEIELQDIWGRSIIKQSVTPTKHKQELITANLANGIYLLTVNTNRGSSTVKFVKQ